MGKRLAVSLISILWSLVASGMQSDTLSLEVKGEREWVEKQVFQDSLDRQQFVQGVLAKLRKEGFLLAKVVSVSPLSPSNIHIEIQTFSRFEWLVLKPGNVPREWLWGAGFDPRSFEGSAVDFELVEGVFEKILQLAQNGGFPFASVGLDSIFQEERGFTASMRYEPGPFITYDTLEITGNSKTQPIFLARLLKIPPGDPFSQQQIDRSLPLLRNLPYVQLLGEPSLSFQNEEATLYLPINDRRMNTVDGIIGVLPNEIEGNRLLVTGQFDIELYNVSGKGRNYGASWQRLSQYSQNLRLRAEEPMVLGSGIDIKASFYLLKEDTTFLNRDFKLDLGYRLNPNLYISFFNRRQAGDLLSTAGLVELGELPEVADFRYSNYGMDLEYTALDDTFFPKRGNWATLEIGLGNKRIIQNTGLSPEIYQGLDLTSFQHYMELGYSYYHLWKPNLGTVIRFRAGNLENRNLLLNDLFRIGGLKTIRGFNENYFFASQYAYINIEPRFYFDTTSYFLIFADAANLENRVVLAGRDWPFSFGTGFSMQTRGGIFNFIYAVGKSATQPLGFNYSRIHFGYTGRF